MKNNFQLPNESRTSLTRNEAKPQRTLIFSFLILVFIFTATSGIWAQNATLYLLPSTGNHTVGSIFSVAVRVSTGGTSINAAEGVLIFNAAELSVVSISKSGSIFTLWTTEPTFSNAAGTIEFGGGTPVNFTGAAGTIITITFRAKKDATANVNFLSGAILAADGKGTNILANMSNGTYTLRFGIVTPPTEEEEYIFPPTPIKAPAAPIVSSLTHPDEEKWYSNNDPEFSWQIPPDVTAVRLLIGKIPRVAPVVLYVPPISERKLEDLADGVWYFHVQFRNQYGWGRITHRKVLIDTAPPLPFKIEVKEGKETTNPRPTLFFEATDEMSGIDYYEVKVSQESLIKIKEKEYQIPAQALGRHTIIVKALDKAGNEMLAMTEINILPIETPVITDYPQTLLPGTVLSVKGTALPENKIKVYFQKDREEPKIGETKSDKEGKWFYIGTEPLSAGVYKVWVEAVDSLGARSQSSEKIAIRVAPPAFIRIGKLAIDYLATIITLLVLILVIVLGIIWSWQKIKQRKKRLRKEITEVEKVLYHAFKALKEEAEEQVAKLDGKPDLSDREKKICDELKKALKISEKFISKEVEDIKKEVK